MTIVQQWAAACLGSHAQLRMQCWRAIADGGLLAGVPSFQVDHSWKLEGAEERAAAVLRQQLGLKEGTAVGKHKTPMPRK